MKATRKDVHITIHVDQNGLTAIGPPDAVPNPGDRIVWKTCDAMQGCHVHICNFRESATGKAKNPTKDAQYDADAQGKAFAEVREDAEHGLYKYTIRVVSHAKAAAMVERCLARYALAGAETATPETPPAGKTFVDAGRFIPTKLLMEFAQLVRTEQGFNHALMMLQLDADSEMNPDIQVGGGPGAA